jgi:RNA polymerase sigma factor (sigma-70 family)
MSEASTMGKQSASTSRSVLIERDGLAPTEWSVVLGASGGSLPALDQLCHTYWRPVYVFVRANGVNRNEAEDVTQDFFADMLRRDWLTRVAPEHGSFRAFLRVSVRNFLSNRWRHAEAKKRGGGEPAISFDSEEVEQQLAGIESRAIDPALAYEHRWAQSVLQAALDRLAAEQNKLGQQTRFEKLRGFLTRMPSAGEYAQISDELQLSQTQIAMAVHRLSRRFGDLIRAEVAATVANREDIEAELRYLMQLMSTPQ